MAMRSTDAATTPASPEQAGKGQAGTGQAGTGQGATDWTEQALFAEAREEGVPGAGSPWRWFFSGVWLIYLIQPVAELFHHHDAAWIVGGVVITLAFCVIYMPVLMFSDTRPRLALYGLGVLAVLATVACVVYGKSWTPLWIYVSAASGMVLTSVYDRRRAYLGVLAITGCYLFFCWVTHLDMATTLAPGVTTTTAAPPAAGCRAAQPDQVANFGGRNPAVTVDNKGNAYVLWFNTSANITPGALGGEFVSKTTDNGKTWTASQAGPMSPYTNGIGRIAWSPEGGPQGTVHIVSHPQSGKWDHQTTSM